MTAPFGYLSPAVRLRLSKVAIAAMDVTMLVERPTNAQGTWGQTTESFATVASGVPCLASQVKGKLLNPDDMTSIIAEKQQWLIEVADPNYGGPPEIMPNDKLTVTTPNMVTHVLRVQNVGVFQSYGILIGIQATEVR